MSKAPRPVRVVLWLAFLLLPLAVLAETVYLRDGRVLEGSLIGQSRTEIRLRTDRGLVVINKTKIRRIAYSSGHTPVDKVAVDKAAADKAAADARQKEQLRQQAELARRREIARKIEKEKRKANQDRKTPGQPARADGASAGHSRWGAPLRSAALPGWGHQYLGSPLLGWTYSGVFVGAAAFAAGSRAQALTAKSKYDAATARSKLFPFLGSGGAVLAVLLDQQARSTYEKSTRQYRQSLGLVAFVYLFQFAHAFWSGWSTGSAASVAAPDRTPGSSFVINANPTMGTVELGFRLRL